MKPAIAALALTLLAAGCGSSLPAYPVPPPLPAESIPLPPVSEDELIWRPGDWQYVDGSYRFDPGHYEPRGSHGTLWTRGHWAGPAAHAVWVPGAWS